MEKYLRNLPANRNSIFLTILGLVGYFSFYAYVVSLFAQIGIDAKQYSVVQISFSAARIAEFNRQMIEGGKLDGYIQIHQWNLLNPPIFVFAFFLLAVMIVRRLNWQGRFERVCMAMPFVSIMIAVFDLTATALVLISTMNPLEVPSWVAVCLGSVNIMRYPLLLVFMGWVVIALGYICTKIISDAVKHGRGIYS